ncbi:MAG TPA: DinB family protein [Acidimicrobiales bacterium]
MDVREVYEELFGRIRPLVDRAVSGLTPAELATVPAPGTNSIGWLAWHIARIGDHHLSEVMNADQVWVTSSWPAEFGLAPDPDNVGYGHTPDDVASVQPTGPDACLGYLDEVVGRTKTFLTGLTPDGLDVIVDRRWDPPVTLGVRLVSIANDALQHAGQAAYVRGLLRL